MKMTAVTGSATILLWAFGLSIAESADSQSTTVASHGFVAFENAQVVKGISSSSGEWTHAWLERALVQFSHEFTVTPRMKGYIAVEGQYGFSYPQDVSVRETMLPRFWLYPARVEGTYAWGDPAKPYLQFGLGYFPYKYNDNVVNLGEFLFRSGTYPPYIVNSFNMPFYRLLGFRLSSTLFSTWKQDLLFTSEAQIFPTQDFSLSYITSYAAAKCLKIGAGISLAHLFSIEHRLTQPTQFPDSADPLRFTEEDKYSTMYITKKGDTAYYTFAGTKPMVMAGFDPKPLLPGALSGILGKEDGKLYGEVCVIGWTNYQNYSTDSTKHFPDFRNRWDRTPIMFGMNIPAFGTLDVFSVEFEHYSTKYTNSYKNVIDRNLPAYFPIPGKDLAAWKWSVYAKKTFLARYCLIGEVARDHMRPSYPSYLLTERDDVLARPGDWWWVLRLMAKF